MKRSIFACAAIAAAMISISVARADTVATFADPGSLVNPLFAFTGTLLSGQWLQPGLTLIQGPTLGGLSYANAKFVMPPVLVSGTSMGNIDLGPGQINFTTSLGAPLLTVSFTGAHVIPALVFGASDFWSDGVTFSGPLLNNYTASSPKVFSFAFANPAGVVGAYTASASFTSSADLALPAPGSAAMIGLGGLLAARRRR